MKWMDRPSVAEVDRGGVYEMDRQTKCQKKEITLLSAEFNFHNMYFFGLIKLYRSTVQWIVLAVNYIRKKKFTDKLSSIEDKTIHDRNYHCCNCTFES